MRLPLIALLAVTACSTAQTTQTQTVMSDAIAAGQLVCQIAGAYAPSLVAVVNAADNSAVTVTGRTAAWVAGVCSAIGAIPVPAPATPTALPVKAVTVAAR